MYEPTTPRRLMRSSSTPAYHTTSNVRARLQRLRALYWLLTLVTTVFMNSTISSYRSACAYVGW